MSTQFFDVCRVDANGKVTEVVDYSTDPAKAAEIADAVAGPDKVTVDSDDDYYVIWLTDGTSIQIIAR